MTIKPDQRVIFYVGGCRSGKSSAALERAQQIDAPRKIFVATCQPHDAEMRRRIERHQAERDASWETIETPIDIVARIQAHSRPDTVLLVDCLTLWLTNILMDGVADDGIESHFHMLASTLRDARGPVILVANEVGLGLVPDNALGRRFRDWAGSLNQRVAGCAGEVVLTVAGIPMTIKPAANRGSIAHP
jgi:adenosylcobinamide kinase/adenosylcobinamide-phosphate guanylyltransferase